MILGPFNYEIMLTFILIGVLMSMLSQRLGVSYTTSLLLLGIFITFLNIRLGLFPQAAALTSLLSTQVFFGIILPPIIFKATLDLDLNLFADNLWPIVYLATIGVLISVVLISLLVHLLLGMPWFYSLIFATIISPTDPVGVIVALKRARGVSMTASLVEGEALLNDATAVSLFSILLSIRLSTTFLSYLRIIGAVFLLSPVIGYLMGYFARRIMPYLQSMESRIALLLSASYISFLISQAAGGSGIISEIITGVVVSRGLGDERGEINAFWSVLDYIVTSLLFISMGLVFNPYLIIGYGAVIAVSFIIVFISRVALVRTLRLFRQRYDYPLVVLSGIRGAIPLVLALNLPEIISSGTDYTRLIVAMTVGIASISLIFQTALAQRRISRIEREMRS
ncbi:MAG: cation:proton antiporter [Nitrososphaeria archaeon]